MMETVTLSLGTQDHEASNEATDELATRQLSAIATAVADPVPAVRAAAAAGICGMLNLFWELLPPHIIMGLLKRLTGTAGLVSCQRREFARRSSYESSVLSLL